MTQQHLEEIDKALRRGETPEEIAKRRGLTRTALIYQLMAEGKKITTFRRLEEAGTLTDSRETAIV